jgi:hypothetical protein
MGFLWSQEAVDEQRAFNRITEQVHDTLPNSMLTHGSLSTLVAAAEVINVRDSGLIRFMRGNLLNLETSSTDTDVGYNLIMDRPIEVGAICLAQRIMLPDSGEAGWLVFRIPSAGEKTFGEFECEDCLTGLMPRISLSISGLADTADATFDGWATAVQKNSPYELTHGLPFGICSPGIAFTVPYNAGGTLPLGFQTLTIMLFGSEGGIFSAGGTIGFGWQALTHIGFDIRGVDTASWLYYEENPGAGGSLLMSRTNGKVDCSQTYADYTYLQGEEAQGANFKSWIDQGEFKINP